MRRSGFKSRRGHHPTTTPANYPGERGWGHSALGVVLHRAGSCSRTRVFCAASETWAPARFFTHHSTMKRPGFRIATCCASCKHWRRELWPDGSGYCAHGLDLSADRFDPDGDTWADTLDEWRDEQAIHHGVPTSAHEFCEAHTPRTPSTPLGT